MRATFYSKTGLAKEVLKIDNFEIPKLKENEVLLEMEFSSVNPADTKKRSGWISPVLDKNFIIPHSDGSGKIVEVGNPNNKELIGKKVWICGGSKDIQFGTCAEFFVANINHVFDIPEKTSFSIASCLGVPVATAYFSVFSENKPIDKTVFISGGAGAVSQYAIQFAKFSGAKVITTVSNEKKRKICEAIGADVILNYKELNDKEIENQIFEFTNGNFIDRCIEVDFSHNINLIPKILKNNGTLSSYSCSSNPNPNFPYYLYAPKGIKIKIVQAYLQEPSFLKECGLFVNDLLKKEILKHPSIMTYDFQESHKAHIYQEDPLTIGKSNIKIK